MENAGPGSRGTGYGATGYGVPGVENTGSGVKHGVWKKRGVVEKTGSGGKHGVWRKTRGVVENKGASVENTGSKCKTQRNHYFAQQWSLNFVISNCNENQSA